MVGEPKFGVWNKNPEVVKNWSASDYFLNNREIYYSQKMIMPIANLTSNKNTTLLMVLYALFDLTYEKKKDYFNFKEIAETINTKIRKYKMFLKEKGFRIIERKNMLKASKSGNRYDVARIIEREKKEFSEFMLNFAKPKNKPLFPEKIRMDDIYNAIGLLTPVLVHFKIYTKEKDYGEYEDDEPTKKTHILYYLSPAGKNLMDKHKSENYII